MKKLIISTALATAAICGSAQVNSPAPDGYASRGELMYRDQNYIGCIDQMTHLKAGAINEEQLCLADYLIAQSAAHLGQTDAPGLLRYFIWRHKHSPLVDNARLTLANLSFDAGRYGDALTEYLKIGDNVLDRSGEEERQYNMAYCYLKITQYDKASASLKKLLGSKQYGNGSRFYLAYIDYVNGDYRKAVEGFKKVDTAKAPGNMTDYYLSQIYFKEKDYSKALASARKLMKLDVDNEYKAEATRIAGESLCYQGNESQGIPLLEQYVASVDNPELSSLYLLGLNDYNTASYSKAIERLTPVTTSENAMGQSACLYVGLSMMNQANYSGAIMAFDKASRANYDSDIKETALYNYAVAKTQGGSVPFGSSVATFEEFLNQYPNSRYATSVREYLVDGYMTDNNYPAALASIEAISNPSEKILKAKQQVLYTLGGRELAAGQTTQAISHLRQARALSKYNAAIGAETDLWLGEALYADGNYSEAAKSLTDAVNNKALGDTNRPLALYDLGYAQFSSTNYDDARSQFNKFVNSSNKSTKMTADAYNRIGDTYYYDRNFSDATNAYAKAYSLDPSTGDYALYQGALMKGLQQNRQGKIADLKTMLQKFPDSGLAPAALLELGDAYDQSNMTDKTVETYTTLANKYPNTPQGRQANLLLALAYVNQGNTDKAEATYKKLITQSPSSEEAKLASDRLKQLMAEQGQLQQYAKFINSTPGATPIEAGEMEQLTFKDAEQQYLTNGKTDRLVKYINEYPNSANSDDALAYLVEANQSAGNNDATLKYAQQLISSYPDSRNVAKALKAKADVEYAQGKGELALETYTTLEQSAPDAYTANTARLGIIRTARDLGLNDRVISAASAIESSSTVTTEQRQEAMFARAMALSTEGDKQAARAIWQELSADTDNIYGAKSAYYLAQSSFDSGNLDQALSEVTKLIDSDTPHNYWLARGFILLADIHAAKGNDFEAREYLQSVRSNYPGTESDIFNMIDQRLQKQQ
jgi:tetratricopeptide (TPR) repeat protein